MLKQRLSVYVPSRTKKGKTGWYTSATGEIQAGTKTCNRADGRDIPGFHAGSCRGQLVVEETSTDASRQKIYRVTGSGEIAFQLFSDPATSTLVRSMPEKVGMNPG
jgi:hypothetical protein